MKAAEILKSGEKIALSGGQFISNVSGKSGNKGKLKTKKAKAIGAGIFIVIMLCVPMIVLGAGEFAPVALSENLIEATDAQYADAVHSKQIVFGEALSKGEVPENTAANLKENGAIVGNVDASGNFIEDAKGTSIKVGDKIVNGSNFYEEVNKNVELYSAFNNATYDRAAYYYDDYAQDVFNDLGVTRNSYTGDSDFEEVMDGIMGEGSNISVSDVTKEAEKEEKIDENGNTIYEDVYSSGESASSDSVDFVKKVGEKSKSKTKDQATMDAASSLETADNISREQRSSKFYIGIMENVSKMKAGEGNEAKLNEAMNYLYSVEKSEIVDTKTGEVIVVEGSAMESPSLFAVLSGESLNPEDVKNYSSERITDTIKNKMENGVYNLGGSDGSYSNTVTSATSGLKGSISRYISSTEEANTDTLDSVGKTIDNSLIDNSFKTIKGVAAGEMLVEGAINVGASLALASGATVGDATAVNAYTKLTNQVLAMDAAADRLNRSPLDITSKNTFLGSLVRKFAVEVNRSGSFLKQFASFARVTANAATSLVSIVRADEENNSFMKPYDGCERWKNIGAVSTTGCFRDETFDSSTLGGNILDDNSAYMNFVNNNTKDGKINDNSYLAKFILYNNKRQTPVGVMDGGILDSVSNGGAGDGSGKVGFVSSLVSAIKKLFSGGPSETDKAIASGKAFVNSGNNTEWQNYKYAQRYVSISRARSLLRRYDGGENAYINTPGFNGAEDPVIAFIKEHTEYQDSIAVND